MQAIKQSESTVGRRTVFIQAAVDPGGAAYTSGLSGADLRISKAGGAEANSAGTATHLGGGVYKYEFTTGEVDTVGPVNIRISKAGVFGDSYVFQVVSYDPYGTWSQNMDAAVSSRLAQSAYQDPQTVLDFPNGIETGMTLRQALRLTAAVLGGRLSGSRTGVEVFRNAVADSKNRVTATIDSSGNRTVITTDLT